jgi:hypothetical protein
MIEPRKARLSGGQRTVAEMTERAELNADALPQPKRIKTKVKKHRNVGPRRRGNR